MRKNKRKKESLASFISKTAGKSEKKQK